MNAHLQARARRRRILAGILIGILVGAVHAVISHVPPARADVSAPGFALVDVDGTVVAVVPAQPSISPDAATLVRVAVPVAPAR